MPFTIRNSNNQKGLFTTSFIESNHILFPLDGSLVTGEVMRQLPIEDSVNLLQVLPEEYLDITGSKEIFVNHSCNPNTGIKTLGRRAVLIAIRQIKAGEEISFDYSSTCTESRDEYQMDCHCLSWNCRKVISGFQYLSKIEQKYLIDKGVVPDYVIQFIKGINDL